MQKKVLPILFITLLLDMIGTGMLFPLIPILFTDPSSPSFLLAGYTVGTQYFIAGGILAIFGLMQFLAAPILGELSDMYGRKRLLLLGVGVLAISQLLFGFGITVASLSLIFFARALAGLAASNFSIVQASIADITEPKDRAKNFGLIGSAYGIGFILGPLLGGWIAHIAMDAAAPFWFAGVLGVINLIVLSVFYKETRVVKAPKSGIHILKGVRNINAAFQDVNARPVYLSSFLYMSGFSFFTSFIGILLVSRFHFNETDIATFFGVVGICIVITQIFVLRIVAKSYTEKAILYVSLIFSALFVALYAVVHTSELIYLLIPFLAVSQGLTMTNIQTLVSKSVSGDKQGAALGINGSLMAFAQGYVPLLAGVGTGFFGLHTPFLAGAMLILFAWMALFVWNKKRVI